MVEAVQMQQEQVIPAPGGSNQEYYKMVGEVEELVRKQELEDAKILSGATTEVKADSGDTVEVKADSGATAEVKADHGAIVGSKAASGATAEVKAESGATIKAKVDSRETTPSSVQATSPVAVPGAWDQSVPDIASPIKVAIPGAWDVPESVVPKPKAVSSGIVTPAIISATPDVFATPAAIDADEEQL